MNVAALALRICRELGKEFPFPPEQMRWAQGWSLAEEGFELEREARHGNLLGIQEETADLVITAYIAAHYYGIDLTEAGKELTWAAFPGQEPPWAMAGLAIGEMRRYCGVARRSGTLREVGTRLVGVVWSTYRFADGVGFSLDEAIQAKADKIFTRGWHEYRCGACGKPIAGDVWYHNRLAVHLHGTGDCQRDVKGEDVRTHCMTLVRSEVRDDVSHSGL